MSEIPSVFNVLDETIRLLFTSRGTRVIQASRGCGKTYTLLHVLPQRLALYIKKYGPVDVLCIYLELSQKINSDIVKNAKYCYINKSKNDASATDFSDKKPEFLSRWQFNDLSDLENLPKTIWAINKGSNIHDYHDYIEHDPALVILLDDYDKVSAEMDNVLKNLVQNNKDKIKYVVTGQFNSEKSGSPNDFSKFFLKPYYLLPLPDKENLRQGLRFFNSDFKKISDMHLAEIIDKCGSYPILAQNLGLDLIDAHVFDHKNKPAIEEEINKIIKCESGPSQFCDNAQKIWMDLTPKEQTYLALAQVASKRSETILETYETWAAGFPVTAKKKLPLEELSKQCDSLRNQRFLLHIENCTKQSSPKIFGAFTGFLATTDEYKKIRGQIEPNLDEINKLIDNGNFLYIVAFMLFIMIIGFVILKFNTFPSWIAIVCIISGLILPIIFLFYLRKNRSDSSI